MQWELLKQTKGILMFTIATSSILINSNGLLDGAIQFLPQGFSWYCILALKYIFSMVWLQEARTSCSSGTHEYASPVVR